MTQQDAYIDETEDKWEEESGDNINETDYLLSSSANAERLREAKKQIEAGELIEVEDIDDLDDLFE